MDNQQAEQVLSILKRVDARLSDPSKWTKDVFARNESGQSCSYLADQATCYCLMGALFAEEFLAYGSQIWTSQNMLTERQAINLLHGLIPGNFSCVSQFNDASTFEEIKALLAVAIENLEAELILGLPETENPNV